MDAQAKQKLLLLELADHLLKNWWTLIAGFCIGLSAALVLLQLTPKVYQATAQLDLASERLPKGLVADTVVADPEAKLAELRRNVLSERYLDKIIAGEFDPPQSPDGRAALMGRIRSGVSFALPPWGDKFQISFRDQDPARAARIANRLAGLYVEENLRFRQGRAAETAETLRGLAAQRWEEIQELAGQLQEFDAKNPSRREADRPRNQQLLEQSRLDLEANLTLQADLQLQIDYLEAEREVEALIGLHPSSAGESPAVADAGLVQLEVELEELLADYSEKHPTVRKKQAEIEKYRRRSEAQHAVSQPTAPVEDLRSTGPASSFSDLQIASAEGELNRVREEERVLRADIARFQRRLADTPHVELRREELEGELDTLTAEYGRLRGEAIQAETSERVEQQGRGDQFQIFRAAVAPSRPVHPRPLLFYGAGIGVGVLLIAGPGLARRILVPVICSESRMAEAVAVPILVTIPSIPTPAISRRLWIRRLTNAVLSALAIAVLATVLGLQMNSLP